MRRAVFILIAVGILAALVVAGITAFRRGQSQVAILPDGTRVELLAAKISSESFTTEKSWQKQARKILPVRWQNWIQSPINGSCGGSSNTMTVYLKVNAPMSSRLWDYWLTQGNDGFTYQRGGGSCSFGGGTPGTTVHGLYLRSFPRRQPNFPLQLVDAKGAVMAKFTVENPVRGPFPEWQPLPMPQTQTNGPVTLTLESLRESGSDSWRSASPKWKLAATETNWSHARARYITLFDATGNEGYWLSPREKAWKVRAQVFRERLQDFGPDEYIALTNVPVPAPGENVYSAQPVERSGVTLTIHAIGGRGAIANTNGTSWEMVPNHPGGTGQSSRSSGNTTIEEWSSMKPFLLLEVGNAQAKDEIRIQVRDDQGREVKLEDSGYSSRVTGKVETRRYIRRFSPADDAKSLNLEIIVNRPLEFEFMVNPADVKSAKK